MTIDKGNAKPTTSVQLKIHRLEVLEEILRVIEAPPRDPCLPGQHRGPISTTLWAENPKSTTGDGQAGPSAGMV
jgi:hypothetical protein